MVQLSVFPRTHITDKDMKKMRVKEWKSISQANGSYKESGIAILLSDKVYFKPKPLKGDKDDYYILIRGKVH